MRRRQALHGVLALVLPIAGCAEDPPTANGTGTATDAPNQVGETASIEGIGEVTVTSITVQRAVTSSYLGLDVYEPENGQVIVVETDEVFGPDESAPLVPRLDGERVDPPTDITLRGYRPAGAVAVPVRDVERAAVVMTRGEEPAWALPDGQVQRLGAAPEFALQDATFDHESAELTLTVENSGDRDGRFRGGVDFGDDYTVPIEFPVAAGESHTETVTLSPPWEATADREFDVSADTRVLQFDQ